jgi:hypothetical protein
MGNRCDAIIQPMSAFGGRAGVAFKWRGRKRRT